MRNILLYLILAILPVNCMCSEIDSVYMCERPSMEVFHQFCNENSILYPEVVWAQARLESGNFKSVMYLSKKNCLGIYDSRKHEYARFSHWTECVVAYRDRVQYRYKGPSDNVEEYLVWLDKIGYAASYRYIELLREIMRKP